MIPPHHNCPGTSATLCRNMPPYHKKEIRSLTWFYCFSGLCSLEQGRSITWIHFVKAELLLTCGTRHCPKGRPCSGSVTQIRMQRTPLILYLPTKNGEEAVFFDPNDQNSESDFQEIPRHPAIFLDLKKINAGSNT